MGLVFSTVQAAEAPALAPARPGAMVPPPPLPSGPLAADLSKARRAVLMLQLLRHLEDTLLAL
jgi:hypothetical protein